VRRPFEIRGEPPPHWPELYGPSWELRPSLDADEEPTPGATKASSHVQVHKPLIDEPLSEAPVAPATTTAAASPPVAPPPVAPPPVVAAAPMRANAAASGGVTDRYVLLASLWESGQAPASLVSSNGLLALAVPAESPLASIFRKGDGYRFQQDAFTATYECLEVFATPQEAFANYPEGMRVSNQPPTYLHWREPSEPGALNAASWVQSN